MQPTQLQQLVKDRQADLLADGRRSRSTGRTTGGVLSIARRGLRKTGLGLIRVGVRLAGPELSTHRSTSGAVGMVESPS